MKLKKTQKKLSLQKATVTHLGKSRMKDVKGGDHIPLSFAFPYCTEFCTEHYC